MPGKQFAFDYGDGRGPVYKSGKSSMKKKSKSIAKKLIIWLNKTKK